MINSAQRVIEKEEGAVIKEEKSLLREVTYLEEFKKEIDEILKIKVEIQKFNKFRIEDRVKRIYYLFLPGLAGHYLSNLMELNP